MLVALGAALAGCNRAPGAGDAEPAADQPAVAAPVVRFDAKLSLVNNNGAILKTVRNTGANTDTFRIIGSGTMSYKICNNQTQECADPVEIQYNSSK
ncbi:hypothetical protein K4L06_20825 [Lysobacter sp. BMK333-48F3]|uniref:hypothetical protein n=1 Tax=Lysobacter sp. BMK333-48F3 TaxID=2867962 RepID=UPI001C8C504B|nr:hypothetical protein [Lysobacter sp. BMK333-48F3]MBX9403757.1 hypothetical protein [Lysobacter sp. BMK333-48F3]